MDSQGIIVLWYIPDAITRARNVLVFPHSAGFLLTVQKQDHMVLQMNKLQPEFKQSLPPTGSALKTRQRGYKPLQANAVTSPGHIPFSPCWFNIAHQLSVSRSLRGWPQAPTIQYLRAEQESLSLMSAVLAVIHPRLAMQGLSILRGIQSGDIWNVATDSLGPVRRLWPSPFTAFSLISNRETELHRDAKGFTPYYDITTTLGHYCDGRFEVPGIGLRFKYNPGTIIGISGKALAHGVAEVEGTRYCLAQYFHRQVLNLLSGYTLEEQSFHWSRTEDFLQH